MNLYSLINPWNITLRFCNLLWNIIIMDAIHYTKMKTHPISKSFLNHSSKHQIYFFSRYIAQILFAKIQHNKQWFVPCIKCIANTSDKLGTYGMIYKSTCCKRKLRPAVLWIQQINSNLFLEEDEAFFFFMFCSDMK